MTTFKTPAGTELPLLKLKGKPYLQVAHRLVWFVEENDDYSIETKIINLTETSAVVQASISFVNMIVDGERVYRTVTAMKMETKAGFADFLEKAETGAIGRALALLGYGTQFTADELDEGNRLADSPIKPAKRIKKNSDDF